MSTKKNQNIYILKKFTMPVENLKSMRISSRYIPWGIIVDDTLFYFVKEPMGNISVNKKYFDDYWKQAEKYLVDTKLVCKYNNYRVTETILTLIFEKSINENIEIIQKNLIETLLLFDQKITDQMLEQITSNEIFSIKPEIIFDDNIVKITKNINDNNNKKKTGKCIII